MREILFRGKSVNNGEWVQGSLVITTIEPADDAPIKHYHIEDMIIGVFPNEHQSGLSETVDPETVGQFTGLTDKNGTKIFEGDVLEYRSLCKNGTEEVFHAIVIWTEHTWAYKKVYCNRWDAKWNDYGYKCDLYKAVVEKFGAVIGNIHDNPELLEVTDNARQKRKAD